MCTLIVLLAVASSASAQCWGVSCGCVGPLCPPSRLSNAASSASSTLQGLLPKGSHCVLGQRSGNKCCNTLLYQVMKNSFGWAKGRSDFTSFGKKQLAFAARLVLRLIQKSFGKSFEVVISEKDFSQTGDYHGNLTCKYEDGGMHVLAYATPVQYDVSNDALEKELADVDSRDPLGVSNADPRLQQFLNLAVRLVPKVEIPASVSALAGNARSSASSTFSRVIG